MPGEIEYTVNLDFKNDYAIIRTRELVADGYTVTETDPFEVAIQYNNYKSRLPEARIRKVLKSTTFSSTPDQDAALAEIERRITQGETIRPYLSTRLGDLNYSDALLNDWAIHHLHLGTVMKTNGFINRTGPLLFAYFDKDTAYFLAIGSHNSFSDQDLIEIMHRDFPKAIQRFKSNVIAVETSFTNDDIKELRKRVIYMLTLSDGTVYHSIGGGSTTSGVGAIVAIEAGRWLKLMVNYEDVVKANIPFFVEHVKDKLPEGDFVLDMRFVGWKDEDTSKPVVWESKSDIQFALY